MSESPPESRIGFAVAPDISRPATGRATAAAGAAGGDEEHRGTNASGGARRALGSRVRPPAAARILPWRARSAETETGD